MKHAYRLIALILMILLLTFCASAETVDFGALAAKGNVDSHVGVTVTCPPKLGAMSWCGGTEQYAIFNDWDNRYYVSDYSGNILFTLGPDVSLAELTEGNFVIAFSSDGIRVYDVRGKQLNAGRYILQNDNRAVPTGVGDGYVLISNYATDSATGRQCFLMIGPDGQNLAAEGFGRFWQGIVPCCRDGKWGAQEPFGKTVLPYTYDYLEMTNDGVLVCRKNGSWGLIDLEGNTVVPFDYDEMVVMSNDDHRRVAVRQGSRWGVIDLTGKVRVPIAYASIEGTVSPQLGGTPTEWYAAKKPGDATPYNVCEDDAILFQGSPALPTDAVVLSDSRFLRKSWSYGISELVDARGERLLEESIFFYDVFDGGYYFVVNQPNDNRTVGRIYSEDLELKREIPGAPAADQFDGYICFGKTDSVLAVQCISTYDHVELYSYDGALIDSIPAYLMGVYNVKTIVLRKGDTYAIGTADGKRFTSFQYYGAGRISWEDGSNELVNAGVGGNYCLIHNTGTPFLNGQAMFDGVRLLTGVDSGPAMFRVDDQCGFLYVAEPELCFADASDADWFAKSVAFCVNAGLMRGVGNGRFAPQTAMTRAMLVQVLYNLSGEPAGPYGFEDVADTAWYADAVNWAAANEIVNGVSATRFAPDTPVTREQMVTILRRYALRFGEAEGEPDALAGFTDRSRVSAYAEDALCWAVTAGLINGRTPTTLEPQGQAKRAEIATVLMRFVNLMAGRAD